MIVRDAIIKSLEPREYKPTEPVLLWCSEIGTCPRKALFRILGYESTWDPPLELREKFRYGVIIEDETARALKEMYGEQLATQLPLRNKFWSGKTDMVIGLNSNKPIIVEHKATSDTGFNYIPKETHVAQIVLYGMLFQELYEKDPRLLLVYRSWSHYAEFEVVDKGEMVICKGELDGEDFYREIPINITKAREYLEEHFSLQKLPDYCKWDECEWGGKPACSYFQVCRSNSQPEQAVRWGDF
ncbi:MAG: hypothetical protein H8E40_00280 [Chloroflexi bacterium]|nr:hypothetical protein [Chloroflexota bacterium]